MLCLYQAVRRSPKSITGLACGTSKPPYRRTTPPSRSRVVLAECLGASPQAPERGARLLLSQARICLGSAGVKAGRATGTNNEARSRNLVPHCRQLCTTPAFVGSPRSSYGQQARSHLETSLPQKNTATLRPLLYEECRPNRRLVNSTHFFFCCGKQKISARTKTFLLPAGESPLPPCRYHADAAHPVVELVWSQQLGVLEVMFRQLSEERPGLPPVAPSLFATVAPAKQPQEKHRSRTRQRNVQGENAAVCLTCSSAAAVTINKHSTSIS